MERDRGIAPKSESDGSATGDEKKRGTKRVPLLSWLTPDRERGESAGKKPARPEQALGSLLIEKSDAAGPVTVGEAQKPSTAESLPRAVVVTETGEPIGVPESTELEALLAEAGGSYPELPPQELHSVDLLSRGETILDLSYRRSRAQHQVRRAAVVGVGLGEPTSEPVGAAQPAELSGSTQEAEPEPMPVAAAGGGGEVPPTNTHNAAPQAGEAPEPGRPQSVESEPATAYERPEPAEAYRQYMERQAEAAVPVPAGEQPVTRHEVKRAVRRVSQRARQAELAAEAERERYKWRERKNTRREERLAKKLNEARQANDASTEAYRQQKGEVERRLSVAESGLEAARKNQAGEQLVAPQGRRYTRSEWLTIEQDAKTGRAAEAPTSFSYGEEYHRERAQEVAPAVVAATVAAQSATSQPTTTPANNGSLPPVNIPSATTQGPPSAVPQNSTNNRSQNDGQSYDSSPRLWPWLVALVVVAVCLIVAVS
ncbi:MAG TPA: hypothetical protein VLE99_00290 [Candidatus Saccharimonadales bacterium]|nr:hypothetical protein [Candidatus Saccharimonadales bacterium]